MAVECAAGRVIYKGRQVLQAISPKSKGNPTLPYTVGVHVSDALSKQICRLQKAGKMLALLHQTSNSQAHL